VGLFYAPVVRRLPRQNRRAPIMRDALLNTIDDWGGIALIVGLALAFLASLVGWF